MAAAATIVLILANGVFVAGEFALVAADASRVETLAAEGDRRAASTAALLRRLSFHLSGAQLGITITSLLLGFLADDTVGALVAPALELIPGVEDASGTGVTVLVALGIATVLQMVLGELVPKNAAIAKPLPTSFALSRILTIYGTVAGPFIRLLDSTANRIVRAMGVEPQDELKAQRTLDDYEILMRASAEQGSLSARDARLLLRALRFTSKTAAEALQPRTVMVTVPDTATVADLVGVAVESGRSRIVVTGDGDLDDIKGVAAVADVFAIAPAERATTPVAAVTRDAPLVPEGQDLGQLMEVFRRAPDELVVVVDEYGGTEGVVTLEDLLEEIVGEIHDEHDTDQPALTAPQRAGGYGVDGTLHHDELVDLTGFEMPDGDYETLAGYVLTLFGRIPEVGDRIEADGWAFEVLERDRLRVARIRLTALESAEAVAAP